MEETSVGRGEAKGTGQGVTCVFTHGLEGDHRMLLGSLGEPFKQTCRDDADQTTDTPPYPSSQKHNSSNWKAVLENSIKIRLFPIVGLEIEAQCL